jgi:pimeloyl-ACP methyl ester carboxylesterase
VGFGTNSPVYFGFESALDPATLPTPLTSVQDGSSLILIDVDPKSPYWGERFPLQWYVQDFPDSHYFPEHTLAVAPVYGFPLRRNTTYALLITVDAAAPAPGFSEVWNPGDRRHKMFANVPEALFFAGIGTDDVAVGTVFTTRDPIGEMARISRYIQDNIAPPNLDLPLEHLSNHDTYTAYRTHYPSPVFTHGERPYSLEGGGLKFDDDGTPLISSWDDMRLAVCTPNTLDAPPPAGWPVVIYQHGTGGSYRGFCNSDKALEVANRLGAVGLIGLGIDQPLHGTRLGDGLYSDLNNFNILNPDSGVTNFRQGALDVVYLARALARQPWTFTTPEGVEITTDPNNILFMGHSQGGLTGALAAPFVGQDLKAMVLSGAGGVLAVTIVVRVDIIDFAQLVHSLLQFEEGEQVIEFHPVLGLIQTAVEVTDPVNYGPYWFSQPGDFAGHTPVQILLTSGTLDAATDYRTAVALAASARLPVLAPMASSADAIAMRGIEASAGPLTDNARAFDGSHITAGFSQWTDGSHWVVFEEERASDLYVHFLRSTADGRSTLRLD